MPSNAATAAFLKAWRATQRRKPQVLAKIELTQPTARTLYLGTVGMETPDGRTWEPCIRSTSPIRADGGLLESAMPLVSASLVLAVRALSYQAGTGRNILGALQDYVWEGAKVTLYLWEESLTAFPGDAVTRYFRVLSVDASNASVTVNLIQRRDWNVTIPKTRGTADAEQMLIPIVYGDHSAEALPNPPWATATYKQDWHECGAGRYAVPGVIVDKTRGTVQFASHAVKAFGEATAGTNFLQPVFVAGSGTLARVRPVSTLVAEAIPGGGGGTIENDATKGARYTPPDIGSTSPGWAALGITPSAVRKGVGYTTATNPQNALDVNDPTSFATVGAGQKLQLVVPNVPGVGTIIKGTLIVMHEGSPIAMQYTSGMTPVTTGTNAAPKPESAVCTTQVANSWDLGKNDNASDIIITCASGSAKVYLAAIVVYYRPAAELVQPALAREHRERIRREYTDRQGRPRVRYTTLAVRGTVVPEVYELASQFYANLQGYADDGSGTYTGSASALIERAPDIARHLLVTYGGIAGSDITTAGGAFGSFVDARTALKRGQPDEWTLAVHIGAADPLLSILSAIGHHSAAMIGLDEFTDKFVFLPWNAGAAADYDLTIRPEHLKAIRVERQASTAMAQRIRVSYGMDYFRNRTLNESVLSDVAGPTSGQGPNSDETRIATAADEAGFAWDPPGVPARIDYLGANAGWAPIDLAEAVRTKIRVYVANAQAGWGFYVKAGYNDKLDFLDAGAVARVATLAPGYYTADGFAAEVKRALQAALGSITWTVTYDHATGLMKFKASTAATLKGASGAANFATRGWHMAGINADRAMTANVEISANHVMYEDRFWLTGPSVLNVGTGGVETNDLSRRMGWNYGDRSNGGNATAFMIADAQHGDRRTAAAASKAIYGEQTEITVAAPWLRKPGLATKLRNLIFDIRSTPRPRVVFTTEHCPDLRRGAVLLMELDGLMPYPVYGAASSSWVGRRFRVLEVQQSLGPEWHTEVVAVEV